MGNYCSWPVVTLLYVCDCDDLMSAILGVMIKLICAKSADICALCSLLDPAHLIRIIIFTVILVLTAIILMVICALFISCVSSVVVQIISFFVIVLNVKAFVLCSFLIKIII